MSELDEIKSKYPLAVEALKGTTIEINGKANKIDITCANEELNNVLWIGGVCFGKQRTENEIGKMLADILNLIAKP